MTEQVSSLITFYKQGWENHHQALVASIAALSPEQLALPVVPGYVSIGGLLAHMIDARVSWFSGWMGEGTSELFHWHEERSGDEPVVHGTAELIAMFEQTWGVISDALDRWTSADLESLFSPPAYLTEEEPAHTRQWIIWHVLEHEIHHGGKFSLALGACGLDSFYTW